MGTILMELDRQALTGLVPELADIYRRAFSGPPYHKPAVELDSFPEEVLEQLERPGFRAWAAFKGGDQASAGSPVGFAYCYQLLSRYWWHQQVEPHLARRGQAFWLEDAFELTQMAVLPEFQGQGIGGRLHDQLIQGLPFRHGLLSTLYADTNALALYRKRGWQTLLEPFQFEGVNRPYRIMGRALA